MTPSCYAELCIYELWSAAVKTFLGFHTKADTFAEFWGATLCITLTVVILAFYMCVLPTQEQGD